MVSHGDGGTKVELHHPIRSPGTSPLHTICQRQVPLGEAVVLAKTGNSV